MKRLEEIDFLRGFAAICMLIGHSFLRYPIDLTVVSWCATTEYWIFTFHMELFFLLAGVVYKCKDYKSYVVKKSQRILLPYIFFGIITLCFKAFGGDAINGVEPIGEGIKKLILYGGNYWFLYVLFFVFLIYPAIEKIPGNSRIIKASLIVVCIIARYILHEAVPVRLDLLIKYLPYFTLGNLMSKEICSLKYRFRARYAIPIAIAVIVLVEYTITHTNIINPIDYIRALGIICILYYASRGICKTDGLKLIRSLMDNCGKYSLQLYLFNGFLLTALRILLCNVLKIHTPIIIVISIVLGNLLITLFLCKYILVKIPVVNKLCGLI